MKIIEITGVSGAGKSHILETLLKDKYRISDEQIIKRYNIREIYLIYLFFKSKNAFAILKILFKIAKELNMPLYEKLNFIRNSIKKIGKNRYFANINFIDDRAVLVDEGISHIYQNIVTTKVQNNLKILILLNEFISLVDKPDEVIIVDASIKTIVNRLKKRGHKRIKDSDDIELFVKNSKKNLSIIDKKFNNTKIIFNENGGDIRCINYQKI